MSKLSQKANSQFERLGRGFASRKFRWPRRALCSLVGVYAIWLVAIYAFSFPTARLEPTDAQALTVLDASGLLLREQATQGGSVHSWVSLDEISPHVVSATIASEDNNYYEHHGVDWGAIGRAGWLNLKQGRAAFGGSTISMQLVRLTMGTQRSVTGKVKQAVLARRLERSLSKDDILEQYLNRVYYGNGAWGIEQAAKFYFDKSAVDLSVGEAAALAVIPRGPTVYDPFKHRDKLMQRRKHILSLMVKHDYLAARERQLALDTPLRFRKSQRDFRAPHFVEYVREQLPADFQNSAIVRTTLDGELQRTLEVAVSRHVARMSARNLTQAALVVLRNSDGAILAMVGSEDYFDDSRNGAYNGTTARLRPGSTLKPFVYAAALEAGDHASSIAFDVVLPKDTHEFYAKDVRSHGFARYRESLAGSYNLSAVHTLQRAGLSNVLHRLRNAGLWTLDKPDDEYDWGLAIGHAEVRLLDLTAAFTTFSRGGTPVTPRAIDIAETVDGRRWSQPVVEKSRVYSEEVAYIIYDILRDPDARKPMFGDKVPMNLPFDVALKTGTTKAYTDLWAIGTTREYTVGVWGGNFNGDPTHQVKSVAGATPLMRAAYTAIAARYGNPTSPSRPRNVTTELVCPVSGMKPGPLCSHAKRELFVGKAPVETCTWHQDVCGQTNVVYPQELKAWARHTGLSAPSHCIRDSGQPLRIVAPRDGARFILEPYRDLSLQKPPMTALPVGEDVKWFVNGTPVSQWSPTPGRHEVSAWRGDQVDTVTVIYE